MRTGPDSPPPAHGQPGGAPDGSRQPGSGPPPAPGGGPPRDEGLAHGPSAAVRTPATGRGDPAHPDPHHTSGGPFRKARHFT